MVKYTSGSVEGEFGAGNGQEEVLEVELTMGLVVDCEVIPMEVLEAMLVGAQAKDF